MRIVFAGTPEFAAVALGELIRAAPAAGWAIPLVLSQPDRPAGRGLKRSMSPVKQLALGHGIEVATPPSLSETRGGPETGAVLAHVASLAPDVLVVAAYGLILPQSVLDVPRGLAQRGGARLTALNIHASLLPRWRGAAPVARAIEAGDADTGITIMQMEAGLDTGPMLVDERVPIPAAATTTTLTAELARVGARLIVRALRLAERGDLSPVPQPPDDDPAVTYARKLTKQEAWLDWSLPAEVLERKLRAFDPFPVAAARLGDETLRLWRGQAVAGAAPAAAGTVTGVGIAGVDVATGRGTLRITELQRAGGKRLAARDFLAGFPIAAGQRLGGPPDASPPA